MPQSTTSLSRREVHLLAGWERARRTFVTIDDIRNEVGSDAAKDVARALVHKQALERVRRGVYLVRPFRALGRPSSRSTSVMIAAILAGDLYYLGGLWALSFHRLTEQKFLTVIDAFVRHRLQPRLLGPGRVRFHVLPSDKLAYGAMSVQLEGAGVRVSDPERTVLDALDYPRLFGGIARSVSLASEVLPSLDRRLLIAYAARGSGLSTCQRLGVLLERTGTPTRQLAPLRRRVRQTRSLLSLLPAGPRLGPVNRLWNVVENDG